MDEQEAQKLREAEAALKAENARLKEAIILREARDYVSQVLAESRLPDITKARLIESLAAAPVLTEGVLDRDAYKTKIAEAVKAEVEYLATVTGSGDIKGMGTSAGTQVTEADAKVKLQTAFAKMGLSESTAKIAAEGRN